MKHLILLEVAALMTVAAPAQTVRVGTFHKAAIVVAYYRSPMWADTLKAKMAEMQEAKKANDTRKADELEKWGQAHQERAHQQLTGDAPIDDILAALAAAFPEIAGKAKVALIAADLPFASASVEMVDVTGLLLDWLKADDRTRALIAEMRSRP